MLVLTNTRAPLASMKLINNLQNIKHKTRKKKNPNMPLATNTINELLSTMPVKLSNDEGSLCASVCS